MADATSGASGSFQVNRGTLREAAVQADQISDAIGELEPEISAACLPAASAHSGWDFGRALAAAVPRWKGHLGQQSSALSAAGGKLAKSADNYEAAEKGVCAHVRAICSGLAG
jgi:hypothetical protein